MQQTRTQMHLPVYTVGDSHCKFAFENSAYVTRVFWLGPYTLHRFGRDCPTFSHFAVTPYNGPRVVFDIPKDGVVMTCFGEVDVRAHVQRQIEKGRLEEEILDTLANNYVHTLLHNRDTAGYSRIMIYALRPPMRPIPELADAFAGDVLNHIQFRDGLHRRLRQACETHGFGFFDPHATYTDSEGLLDMTLCDECKVHIVHTPAFDDALHHALSSMGW